VAGKLEAYYKEVDDELVGLPLLSERHLEARFAEAYSDNSYITRSHLGKVLHMHIAPAAIRLGVHVWGLSLA
jgi:hypothetical protein